MRGLMWSLVAVAGCASANSARDDGGVTQQDAKIYLDGQLEGTHDAPIDAPRDAAIDARPDAPPDAFRYLDACVPKTDELLANPTFDLAPQGTNWTQVPIANATGGPYYPITSDGVTPQSAPYDVWLGGLTGADVTPNTATVTDQVYQDVAVPANTTSLVITGYYIVGTTETTTTTQYDHGTLELTQTNGTPIEGVLAFSNLSATGATWVAFSHTFTTVPSGQTVRVHFTSTNDISNQTNFFFDTLSLKATHCP